MLSMDYGATDDISPQAPEILARLEQLKRDGNLVKFENAAHDAWQTHPDHFDIAVVYFQHLKQTDQYAKAEKLLQNHIASPQANATSLIIYADILMQMGLFDESWNVLAKAKAHAGAEDLQPVRQFEAAHAQYHPQLNEAEVFGILQAHGEWLTQNVTSRNLEISERKPDQPIRVGLYSPHFNRHPTAIFAYSSFDSENAAEFEWYFYHDSPNPDSAMTHENRKRAHQWRPIRHLSIDQAVQQIRDDRIDMLIDLCGFLTPGRPEIMVQRVAPVQISWQGWPGTTGLRCYDWRLTDAIADPPGNADTFSTEKLYRLPHGHHCYVSPFEYPPVSVPPMMQNGYVTFGSANNLIKYSSTVLETWAEILHRLPHSRLRLRRDNFSDPYCRERHIRRFEHYGLPMERVDLMAFSSIKKVNLHLDFYNLIDIALDPFPYNGMTTTAEPLLMGVPVVALRGERHSSRVSASMITRVGLTNWIADSLPDYIDIACSQGTDLDGLFDVRETLRDTFLQSPLGHEQTFQADMKTALREIWGQRDIDPAQRAQKSPA